ncbi:MAG TPA: hypothetical protein VK728_02710 [Candidatus Sulfotelmatobacter sp.]|jgi:hypothetical protein|nr:hypothetical protein [Candidatus Sulfotelmatobacter sp.]
MNNHLLFRGVLNPFAAIASLAFLCALPIHAQESTPSASDSPLIAPAQQQISLNTDSAVLPAAPLPTELALKNNRLFYVLANYSTVEKQDPYGTISAKTKFKLSVKTMTDPVTVSFLGVVALMGQAQNTEPSYGQGLKGYSKRYATTYTDSAVGTLMTTSVFPTLLHQDPRYFQLGTGTKWHRLKYSVSRIFITRSDSGVTQFNYSEILGNAVAAGISNTYHPDYQRTFSNTMNVWSTDILLNTLCNVAKEFWPDIRRAIHNRRTKQ